MSNIPVVNHTVSFISTDGRKAITSFGQVFSVGEVVGHQGADNVAEILSFTVDSENNDIVVATSRGECTIEFLLKVE